MRWDDMRWWCERSLRWCLRAVCATVRASVSVGRAMWTERDGRNQAVGVQWRISVTKQPEISYRLATRGLPGDLARHEGSCRGEGTQLERRSSSSCWEQAVIACTSGQLRHVHLTSSHVVSNDLISYELSAALWLAAATANRVAPRRTTQFAVAATDRGALG